MLYAAAVAVLLAWLIFSAGANTAQLAPAVRPVAAAMPAAAAPPRLVVEVTVDGEPFHILVGEGPPAFGVAVSAGDAVSPD